MFLTISWVVNKKKQEQEENGQISGWRCKQIRKMARLFKKKNVAEAHKLEPKCGLNSL